MASPRRFAPEQEDFDASNPEQVKKAKVAAETRDALSREFLTEALSKPAGRNWFWSLLSACHVFETSFQQGDPMSTAFREGERNVGLRMIAEITNASPDSLVQMMKEKGNA